MIIASAGMMSGGRIMFHAARWLPDEKTRLIFTGFQAKGTLGRQIRDGNKFVRILGRDVEVRAEVLEITTMSSHADRSQLLDWLRGIRGAKKVILIHGEDRSRIAFKEGLKEKEVLLPALGEEIEI